MVYFSQFPSFENPPTRHNSPPNPTGGGKVIAWNSLTPWWHWPGRERRRRFTALYQSDSPARLGSLALATCVVPPLLSHILSTPFPDSIRNWCPPRLRPSLPFETKRPIPFVNYSPRSQIQPQSRLLKGSWQFRALRKPFPGTPAPIFRSFPVHSILPRTQKKLSAITIVSDSG